MTDTTHTLDATRWAHLRALFEELVALPAADRPPRLSRIREQDPALHAEVAAMLAQDAADDDLIARVVSQAADHALRDNWALVRGQMVLQYRVDEPIGAGGMGVVWKATDVALQRAVAIKVLPPDLARAPRRLARFQQEARLLAALNHPGIAIVHGLHEVDGVHVLAMEHIPGEDLAHRLARGPIPTEQAITIAIQVADALGEAHRRGMVHRDIKPGNLMLMPSGRVKILDFGLATAVADDAAADEAASAAGAPVAPRPVIGTAAYMAPEQARGEAVDARADIWAFGAMLFEMLSGTSAFGGDSVSAVLTTAGGTDPAWGRLREAGVPPGLDALIRRCLTRDPSVRPASMDDVRTALEALQARPAARPMLPALVAAVLVLAIAIDLAWIWPRQSGSGTGAGAVHAVAVLPLADLSDSHDQQYFADGLAEELLGALARNPRLRVIGRTSSFRFREAQPDAQAIGRALAVDTLLQGSVRRSGNRVRISARLVSTSDGFSRWTKTYERELGDIVAVQEEIAHSVASALDAALQPRSDAPSSSPTTGPAYLAYLQGRHYLRLNTEQSLVRAIAFFTEATGADPRFAPAWVGLGLAHLTTVTEGYGGNDHMARAREAVERALALDADAADAHLALSAMARVHDWDWGAASRAAQRALELAPYDAAVLLNAARIASALGRVDEAYDLTRRASTIDPLDVSIFYRLGRYARFLDRLDEAERLFRQTLDLSPGYRGAHAELALVAIARSDDATALAEADLETHPMWRLYAQVQAQAASGRTEAADATLASLIERFQDGYAIQIAAVYIARRDLDRAFAWLDRAFRQRDSGLSQLKGAPEFKPLAGDPRFTALLRQLRLPA